MISLLGVLQEIYTTRFNRGRTQLDLQGDLNDKVAESFEESESAIVASNLGLIIDLEVAPDGYLYGIPMERKVKYLELI